MAHGKSLTLRAIQPRVDTAASVATPNLWRRHTVAGAKAAQISRRRFVRAARRAARQS